MPKLIVVILSFVALIFQSCSNNDIYAGKAKTVDSLSGAVNALISNLKTVDTAAVNRSVSRLYYYRQFIGQNINDTLSRGEADNLQHFISSGQRLESFLINRNLLLNNAVTMNSQLEKLSHDIKNKAIDLNEAERYCLNEKTNASKLLVAGAAQAAMYHTSLEEFRNSLRGVEQIIRSRNNGELPVIIKDTVAL